MQICKSILAIQVFKKFPELKEELWGGEFCHEFQLKDTPQLIHLSDDASLAKLMNVLQSERSERWVFHF